MPRVSILLTCYNHIDFIEEAVQGVIDQTFTDWELVAIDDGSKDGTREWLAGCDAVSKLILNDQNLGTYGSLNRALSESTGEYIAVLNDDDVWLADKLTKQVLAMESNDRIGLCHTFGQFVGRDSKELDNPEPLGFPFPRTGNGDVLASLIERNRVINSAALIGRRVFDKVGIWDEGFYGCGDWHLWLRVARDFDVAYVDEVLTLYRVHETNACRADQKMIDDSRRIRQWLATWDPSSFSGRDGVYKALALNYAALGTELMWDGKVREARQACLESLKMNPTRLKTLARYLATFLPRKTYRQLN